MERIRRTLQRITRSRLNCFAYQDVPAPVKPAKGVDSGNSPVSTSSGSRKALPSTPQQTTLIVAHGAFQSRVHYQPYLDAVLQNTSITNVLVPPQTAASLTPPPDCFAQDVLTLRSAIAGELSSGRDVLLLAHSYGGIPCCEALVDLPTVPLDHTTASGSNGSGRVLGIIFVSAFVADQGQSLVTSHHFGRADWIGMDGNLCRSIDPVPTLYNVLARTDSSMANDLASKLVPQSAASFGATLTRATWKEHPSAFIRSLQDHAMGTEYQDFFIEKLRKGEGEAAVIVKDLESDHSPFVSMPVELALVTEDVLKSWR